MEGLTSFSGQQRSSPPLNLPQVPLHDFISVLRLRRWLEKTERKKKQTEVVNLLNSLTRFAVSAASAERVLIARFCTWKPDHLYMLNGFWVKSRKRQYGICISSRILYSPLYIEALTLKDEKQIHFPLWLRLILKFNQVVCGFLMTLPRKRKKKKSAFILGFNSSIHWLEEPCVESLSGPRRSAFGLGFSREAFWPSLMNGCLCRPGSEAEERVDIDWPFYLRRRRHISW